MASLFAARRKPKRIVRDESENTPEDAEEDNGPVVRRPVIGPTKAKSKLRMSFNPGDADIEETEDIQPKASRIGALNIQRRFEETPTREDGSGQATDRPSYSKAYLEELRNSTPSTPKDLSVIGTPDEEFDEKALDIESKFGKSGISSGIIPSVAEIREKKERRARLAKEQGAEDFIPLEDYDSDGEFKPQRMQVGTYLQRETEKDTRLIPDDEDIAEGFDDYVEDAGRVTLSKKGKREQARKEREQLRELIEEAEDSTDQDESDVERHHAYESAQTHRGMEGLAGREAQAREARRPRQPKETTQIPKLAAGLARLREAMQQFEFERVRLEKRKADIHRERAEIVANQEHIQKSLEEAGQELEKLREQNATIPRADGDGLLKPDRGLESFGNTPETMTPE